jgi:hypothetical protein
VPRDNTDCGLKREKKTKENDDPRKWRSRNEKEQVIVGIALRVSKANRY